MEVNFSKNTKFRGKSLTRNYSFDIPELNKEQAFLFKKLIDKEVLSYDKDLIKELYSNYVYRVSETSTGYLELDKDQLAETKEIVCEFKAEQIWNRILEIQKIFILNLNDNNFSLDLVKALTIWVNYVLVNELMGNYSYVTDVVWNLLRPRTYRGTFQGRATYCYDYYDPSDIVGKELLQFVLFIPDSNMESFLHDFTKDFPIKETKQEQTNIIKIILEDDYYDLDGSK